MSLFFNYIFRDIPCPSVVNLLALRIQAEMAAVFQKMGLFFAAAHFFQP